MNISHRKRTPVIQGVKERVHVAKALMMMIQTFMCRGHLRGGKQRLDKQWRPFLQGVLTNPDTKTLLIKAGQLSSRGQAYKETRRPNKTRTQSQKWNSAKHDRNSSPFTQHFWKDVLQLLPFTVTKNFTKGQRDSVQKKTDENTFIVLLCDSKVHLQTM